MNSDSDDATPDGGVPDGSDGSSDAAAARSDDQQRGDDASASSERKNGESRSQARKSSREPAAVGAGRPAGSARAAARAAAARSGTTQRKGRPTPSRNRRDEQHHNIFVRIMRYLREVISELRKVIWPTQNEMRTYTIVVVLFLIFMIALTWGADFGFAKLIVLIFG